MEIGASPTHLDYSCSPPPYALPLSYLVIVYVFPSDRRVYLPVLVPQKRFLPDMLVAMHVTKNGSSWWRMKIIWNVAKGNRNIRAKRQQLYANERRNDSPVTSHRKSVATTA